MWCGDFATGATKFFIVFSVILIRPPVWLKLGRVTYAEYAEVIKLHVLITTIEMSVICLAPTGLTGELHQRQTTAICTN